MFFSSKWFHTISKPKTISQPHILTFYLQTRKKVCRQVGVRCWLDSSAGDSPYSTWRFATTPSHLMKSFPRGTKVQCHIVKMLCKKMHFTLSQTGPQVQKKLNWNENNRWWLLELLFLLSDSLIWHLVDTFTNSLHRVWSCTPAAELCRERQRTCSQQTACGLKHACDHVPSQTFHTYSATSLQLYAIPASSSFCSSLKDAFVQFALRRMQKT